MFGLSPAVLQLLLAAVENAPTFFEEAKGVFDQIGAAEGGVSRLIRAAASFSALAGHAANSANTAAAPHPSLASDPVPVVQGQVISGGTTIGSPDGSVATGPVDANGNPILNAADQAAQVQAK